MEPRHRDASCRYDSRYCGRGDGSAGIPLHLIDTAGITPSVNLVVQIGIQRSRAAAESADIVLLVFDGQSR